MSICILYSLRAGTSIIPPGAGDHYETHLTPYFPSKTNILFTLSKKNLYKCIKLAYILLYIKCKKKKNVKKKSIAEKKTTQ